MEIAKQMRNIFVLMAAIDEEIPQEPRYNWLRMEFVRLHDEYKYKAPEQWRPWYDEMSKLLHKELGEPDTEWKQRVADIFADKIKV